MRERRSWREREEGDGKMARNEEERQAEDLAEDGGREWEGEKRGAISLVEIIAVDVEEPLWEIVDAWPTEMAWVEWK